MEHTPGEWRFDGPVGPESPHYNPIAAMTGAVKAQDGKTIASMILNPSDGALIAAAPEMHAALSGFGPVLGACIDMLEQFQDDPNGVAQRLKIIRGEARAAIDLLPADPDAGFSAECLTMSRHTDNLYRYKGDVLCDNCAGYFGADDEVTEAGYHPGTILGSDLCVAIDFPEDQALACKYE